jgi:enolase
LDPTQQANIDNIMKELDRTENKVWTGGELNKQEQIGGFFLFC